MTKVNVRARVTELDSLSDALVRLYKAQSALVSDAALAAIMADVESVSERLTTAIKRDAVSSGLEDTDAQRDEGIRLLGTLVEGYTAIPFADQKAAAETLKAVFDKYGKKIAGESYANESSLIESMLADFAAKKAETELLPGVPELLKSLRAAEDAFKAASDAYTTAKTDKGESATAVKKTLLSVMNDRLVPYLTAMAQVEPYKAFAAQAEAEVKKTNDAVAKRGAAAVTTASTSSAR